MIAFLEFSIGLLELNRLSITRSHYLLNAVEILDPGDMVSMAHVQTAHLPGVQATGIFSTSMQLV